MGNINKPKNWPSLFRTWWATSILALLVVALIVGFLIGGDTRKYSWYMAIGALPLVGGIYLVGVIIRILWKRHFTKPIAVTVVLSIVAIVPITWALRIWPVAFPSEIESTEPTLAIRVPTDEPMKVAWGGDSAAGNQHAITSDQRWAYDLMIEPYFTLSADLQDYGCYGVPVVAPVAGRIVQSANSEPEAQPATAPNNPTAPLGNHVVIEPEAGGYLIIAHLKTNSVSVAAGDNVVEGERIGECGNSGNTSEPHVHIHYQRQHPAEVAFNFADGLPLYFRDHDGPAMPVGGLRIEGEQINAIGDVIEHRQR